MKKKRKYASAHLRPGRASQFIRSFDTLRPGDKVIIVCRVSFREQHRKGNLKKQETFLRKTVEERGGVVLDVVVNVWSGKDPTWLEQVARIAKRRGAILLALSTDRYIRHPAFHLIENPHVLPRDADFRELQRCTLGVVLMTFLPPDATVGEVKRHHAVNNGGGRPAKRRSRRPRTYKQRVSRCELAQEKILELRRVGFKFRDIAEVVGWPESTVRNNYHRKANLPK